MNGSEVHVRLTPPEVAAMLGVSERTLSRWVQGGRFPRPVTYGRARHWEKSVVDAWMAAARDTAMK
jgi:excisionase family DNA binding protein